MPKSRRFKPTNLAHPKVLSVSRIIYTDCRFLPFKSACFIFAKGLVESTVKGLPIKSMPAGTNRRRRVAPASELERKLEREFERELERMKQLSIPLFKYSAQVDKIATLHTRGLDFRQIPKEITFLRGLKLIVVRPCFDRHSLAERVREQWDRREEEKMSYPRKNVPSSIQVVFEAGDIEDYELEPSSR